MIRKILLLSIVLFVFGQCARVPVSGRKQMNLVSETTLIEMSKAEYQKFLQASVVDATSNDAEMIQRVGQKLAESTTAFLKKRNESERLAGFEWEFKLVQNPQVNAWCMPGGKICFYTGILPIAKDEDGIAAIMGHEIAHAIARHGNERMSKGIMIELGGMALDIALAQKTSVTRSIFLNAYGIGAQVGYVLPFSRKHELEADKMGVVFMKLAGYDPNKAIELWQRMNERNKGGNSPDFLSTHPNDKKRAEELQLFIVSEKFRKYTEE